MKNCCRGDFAVPANLKIKTKENKKINKYYDQAKELIMLWKMRMMEIPIVIEALRKDPKGLEEKLD